MMVVLVVALVVVAGCGGDDDSLSSSGGAEAADEATSTPDVSSEDADLFPEKFGLPRNLLDGDQLACLEGELEQRYPDGVPDDLTLNTETLELFDEVGAACGIGTP